jgi:stage V sporulation protein D (sporulation-specific penicillin-binding protein)
MQMAKDPGKGMRFRMILVTLVMTVLCMGVLIYRLSVLQITGGQEFQQRAVAQQMRSITIDANRGTIYDRNGKALATSATVWNVVLVPAYIEDDEVEEIAAGLSEILGVEKEEVAARCANKQRYYELIKTKVEEETAQAVLALADRLDTKGITLEENTKRYYPYGDLVAQVLGFTGSENKGAYGIEAYYEEVLAGTPGRKVSAQNAMGTDLDFQYKELYEAVPESRPVKQRGSNGIYAIMNSFKTFYNWCEKKGKTKNNPFRNFPVKECPYGTPYYMTNNYTLLVMR